MRYGFSSLLRARVPFALAALIAGQTGCHGDVTSGPEPDGLRVEALTPTSIAGIVGASASPAPSIRVTDRATYKPLQNVPVQFLAASNTGYTTNGNVVTDADGMASPGEWVFGLRPGVNSLNVIVNRSVEMTFTATLKPDVPAQLFSTLQDQAAFPGQSVSGPAVIVQDRFANPIAEIVVEFEVTAGGGRLQHSSATSDRDGVAFAGTWLLGSAFGQHIATARVPGVEAVAFNTQVLDVATLRWYQLDSVRIGSKSYTPIESGIADARLGMTRFDTCLCKKQEGYFIEQGVIHYLFDGQIAISSGHYVLDGRTLVLPYLQEPGAVDDGLILLQRPDDYDFGVLLTWVYKEVSGTPP